MGLSPDPAAIRQALSRLVDELPKPAEGATGVRREVMAASLSQTSKVCGKPNCKCARGDKHVVYQLSWVEDGKRRSKHIRKDELDGVRAAVARYRHLRLCRAKLIKLADNGAELIDALIEALRVPPPDQGSGH